MVLTTKRYIYTKEMKQYTGHSVKVKNDVLTTTKTETWNWTEFRNVEKFDCELTKEEKELIGKIKTAMASDRYKKEMREVIKTAGRPVKLSGKTVQFSLTGPERKKDGFLDKSVRDVRNLLLYDVATDRVYGFALPSERELAEFQKVRSALHDSFLGRNRWFFGSPLYMLTLCGLFSGMCIYCCVIHPENERIVNGMKTDLDMTLLQENCLFGQVYLQVFTHDYTRYGSHDSSTYEVTECSSSTVISTPTSGAPATATASATATTATPVAVAVEVVGNPMIIAPSVPIAPPEPLEMQR